MENDYHKNVIMHIDVNSAYLSWTAKDMMDSGLALDVRTVPSVIAGNPENRHGIILAKSTPAKKYGITTAMTLNEALKRCPDLLIFPPNYDLYLKNSSAMYDILHSYSDLIERFSIDECWIDYTGSQKLFGDPMKIAHEIRMRMKEELRFTVNVGVSSNKLLAKMAGELEKPDKVHSLWLSEIEE
ncbi:MAG: DNA polymerase IV, partial [Clostridiales Family XIII bacterium]|nr:DNA polymerase IV [Clostridiales Family XIII bacterium]